MGISTKFSVGTPLRSINFRLLKAFAKTVANFEQFSPKSRHKYGNLILKTTYFFQELDMLLLMELLSAILNKSSFNTLYSAGLGQIIINIFLFFLWYTLSDEIVEIGFEL